MQNRNNKNIKVLDVSHHQGVIDWKKVAAAGVKATYIKLTEGQIYLDPKAYKNYVGAKNAGMRVGFYHYAHCTNDPKKEVDFFLNKLGDMKVDLPHCLDLEEAKGRSKAQVSAFGLAWLQYMQQKTGIQSILYAGYGFARDYFTSAFGKYPLWVARYSATNRQGGMQNPGNLSVWDKWAMFQFTDSGKIGGISSNSVDINEMDYDFFKSIDSGVVLTADANPPSSYRKGDHGLGVRELQQNLSKLGYKLPKYGDDSYYGDESVAAVKAFQKNLKLSVDGIAGKNTLAAVAADLKNGEAAEKTAATKKKYPLPAGILKKGDRGTTVYQLQDALAAANFYPNKRAENKGVDGIFGEKTKDAVSRFQSVYLPNDVDGIYGPATKAKLQSALKTKDY